MADEGTWECRVNIHGKQRAVQIRVDVGQSLLIPVDEVGVNNNNATEMLDAFYPLYSTYVYSVGSY